MGFPVIDPYTAVTGVALLLFVFTLVMVLWFLP